MKCTCGAYKTYGARSGSPLHSEWCDTRKFDYDALALAMGEAMMAAKRKMAVVPHTRQVKYCNWMHWPANQKPAVKVVQYTGCMPIYACQDCLDTGHQINSGSSARPMQEWDLNDPKAPAVP